MTLDLSRWQFGITTVFHFIFVPLTIGLALLLAIMQTAAYRNRHDAEKYDKWEKMTRLLASTVPDQLRHRSGDRHRPGVPVRNELGGVLALRGQRLRRPPRHRGPAGLLPGVDVPRRSGSSARTGSRPASTWPRSGWSASARCCRPTSSWPPTPGCSTPSGYKVDGNRAVMTNFWAVMTNSTLISSFLHVFSAALVTATMMLMLGVSAWHLLQDRREGVSPHPGLRHLGQAGHGHRCRSPSSPPCSSATTRPASWRSSSR